MAITATSYIPPGQYESNKVKKFLSINKPATNAAATPNITNKNVATKLCKAFLPISANVLLANLHPTEEPKINKQ